MTEGASGHADPPRSTRDPEVSLVMPVWRPHPEWFVAAVRSALDQRGCELELLVVDDGNERPMSELLDGIDDPRLRVIRIAHGGVSAARNAGTDAARGRFVRYVDADDVLPPDGTRRLLELADEHTIANAATQVCDEQLRPTGILTTDVEGDASTACVLSAFETCHVSMLFPAGVVRAAGPWDVSMTVAEDWDFVLRCLEVAPVRTRPEVVTLYRRHPASTTRSGLARDAARLGQRRVVAKYRARHPGRAREARSALAVYHRSWATQAIDRRWPGVFLVHVAGLARVAPRAAAAVLAATSTSLVRRGIGRVRTLARGGGR